MIHAFLLAVLPIPFVPPPVVGVPNTEPVASDTEGADSVLEVYDLRPLMPRFDSEPSWTRPLAFAPGQMYKEVDSTPLTDFFEEGSPDVIVDLLTQVLGDELRYEGREIAMDGDSRLLVLAPVAIQKRVAAALSALEQVLAASEQIIVDVVEIRGPTGDAWPSGNKIAASEVDRVVAGVIGRGGTHRQFKVGLGAGRTSVLDQMRRFPILFDYDVEIAQGSFILDPIVVEIEEGVRLFLRGVPQPGGLAISAVYQASESLGVRELPLDFKGGVSREDSGGVVFIDGPRAMQTVDLLHRSAAFDSFLGDGQALVFASQADLGGIKSTQIVYLRRAGGELTQQRIQRLPDSTQSLVLVNSESFSLPTMGIDVHQFGPPRRWEGHPDVQATLAAEPSLFLFDWMKFRFSVWRRLGPWAVVITDPSWDNDAAPALEGLLASWKPSTATVGLDVTLHADGGTARVPVRWSLPVRPGSDCGLMLGITNTALYDFDVEVAQFSAATDPVQVPVFNGLCLGVTPSALSGGGYSLDVRGGAMLLPGGPGASFDPQDNLIGPLDQPVHDTLFVDEKLNVEVGSPLVVGGQTKEGERPVLRLEVGVH